METRGGPGDAEAMWRGSKYSALVSGRVLSAAEQQEITKSLQKVVQSAVKAKGVDAKGVDALVDAAKRGIGITAQMFMECMSHSGSSG